MYGKDMRDAERDECFKYMNFLLNERQILIARAQLALESLQQQSLLDTKRIAAIGYCFGGLCALDLARSGADLNACISFHGLLSPPPVDGVNNVINADILVLHGSDDPLAPMNQINDFCEEMTRKQAQWELQIYGNTAHAFTNPNATDVENGILYNALASDRAWQRMRNFLDEKFLFTSKNSSKSHQKTPSIDMINLLFVCVENSCRSQMSQAFAVIHGNEKVSAYSAGSNPSGVVNPKAIETMKDLEYDLSLHDSKSLKEIPDIKYDAVITMGCGDQCPWIPARHHIDWQIPDPKHMSPEDFAKVRDDIGKRVKNLIDELIQEMAHV